jgi:cytochrome c oxidase subunit 4
MAMNEGTYSHLIADPTEPLAHVVPMRVLLAVFATLLVLTFVTVAATWFDSGNWALVIAMGIATVKASLVAFYFMHLRYDQPFYAIIVLTALLFLAIFVSITLLDTFQYQPDVENWRQTTVPSPSGRGPGCVSGTECLTHSATPRKLPNSSLSRRDV